MSETYTPENLLDRLSDPDTLAEQYERGKRRERELLDRHLGRSGGDALSVGCGWHPGRHLLPAPQWRLVAAFLGDAEQGGLRPAGPGDQPPQPRRIVGGIGSIAANEEAHGVAKVCVR